MEEERKVKLKTLNPCIICKICGGYFISPTTVTECLHTFCKSCLVKHLEENNTCPECNIVIHQSHPLQYIKFDRTMQDIVYKLVPGLAESELAREKDFYHAKGMDFPKDVGKVLRPPGPCSAVIERNQTFTGDDWIEFHRADEPVYLHLVSNGIKSLQRPFVRVSGAATVQQLKRYISAALFDSESRADEIEILSHDKNPVGKEHNLFFLYLTTWRYHSHHSRPMMLYYRLKDVFANPLFVMVSPQHTTECE